jgi:hypothetical protein
MVRRPWSAGFPMAWVLVSACVPAVVHAQSPSPPAAPGAVTERPSLILSVAASPLALDDWRRSDGPALVGSLQGRLNRFLALEGEVTRWTAVDDFGFMQGVSPSGTFFTSDRRDREVWTVGTNLLFRGGTPRVTGFAGGGLGVRLVSEDSSSTFICPPGPGRPAVCTGEPISQSRRRTDTSLSPQFGGSIHRMSMGVDFAASQPHTPIVFRWEPANRPIFSLGRSTS